MNTLNNKRKRDSIERIKKVFMELIPKKDINQISVTDICKFAQINRTTFYNNYIDIYDLADKIRENLENVVYELYEDERANNYNSNDFSKIFRLVEENQLFFKTYFKLNYDKKDVFIYDTNQSKQFYNDEFIDYHIEFFKAGFTAILLKWLNNGCIESVEDMCKILEEEYNVKSN